MGQLLPSRLRNHHGDVYRLTQVCCAGELSPISTLSFVLNKTKHCNGYTCGKFRAIRNQMKVPLKHPTKQSYILAFMSRDLTFLDHCGASFCRASCILGCYLQPSR